MKLASTAQRLHVRLLGPRLRLLLYEVVRAQNGYDESLRLLVLIDVIQGPSGMQATPSPANCGPSRVHFSEIQQAS